MIATKQIDNQVQIIFKTSLDLKEHALSKARQEGITLKALLTMAMKAYVNNDLIIDLHQKKEEPSKFLIDSLNQAEEDFKKGNVSRFKNSKELINYLDGLK